MNFKHGIDVSGFVPDPPTKRGRSFIRCLCQNPLLYGGELLWLGSYRENPNCDSWRFSLSLLTSPKDLPPRWTAQAIPSSPVGCETTNQTCYYHYHRSFRHLKQTKNCSSASMIYVSFPTHLDLLSHSCPPLAHHLQQTLFWSTKAKVFLINKSKSSFLLTKAKVSAKLRLRRPRGEERRVCSHWRSPWEAGKVENPVKLNISRLTRREGQQGRVAIWKNVDC